VRTVDKDDGEGRSGAGPLAIAWLILFAAVSGTVVWLYFYGGEPGTGVTAGIPRIVVPLPPAPGGTAETSPPEPAPPAAEAPLPETAPPEAVAEVPKIEPPAEPPPAAEPAKPEAPAETAAQEALPPAAQTKPAETKPAEAKPAEAKPEKPAETKPPQAAPQQAKPGPAKETPKAETPAAAPAQESAPPAEAETQVANLPPEPKPHALDPALIEQGRQGPLPVIGPDGRQPWQVYARPFDENDKRPRIAVVITDLGLSGAATETAIQQLPGSVTLGFSPYAKGLDQWTNLARAAGHEVLLDLPMEPIDYPDQDPGPYTLLTSLDPKQNLFKMQWLLSRATGYIGVTNQMGSRFTTSGPDLKPVLAAIKERGLLFLDSRSSEQSVAAKMAKESGMAWAYNNRFLDATASRDAIDHQLDEIEKIAKKTGYAVAMGSAYPVTIERVAAWIPKAEAKGFAIAPVSAIADKQPVK
jgi:polysaccharide deacetylase 2 family uncharacterized protein YibQ